MTKLDKGPTKWAAEFSLRLGLYQHCSSDRSSNDRHEPASVYLRQPSLDGSEPYSPPRDSL